MTKERLIKDCLTMPDTYIDNPYGPDVDVVKNKTGKSFALVGILGDADKNFINKNAEAGASVAKGDINVTVKCPPELIYILRDQYKAVVPGYYSNKNHWNTIILGKDVSYEEIINMVKLSYELVNSPKKR